MSTCPSCGYCPHCGRRNPQPYYVPYTAPSPTWQWYPNVTGATGTVSGSTLTPNFSSGVQAQGQNR